MALIYCRRCGKQISDKALSCPNCGAAVSVAQQSEPIIYGSQIQKPKKHTGVIVGVIVVLLVVACIITAILIPVNLEADEHKNGTVTEYRASSVGTVYDGGYDDTYSNTYSVNLTVSLRKGAFKAAGEAIGKAVGGFIGAITGSEESYEPKYSEVSILVDGEEIGTVSIGEQKTFDRNLALGEHKLEVVAKTETRVRYSDTIDVTGNNDSYKYSLKCTYNDIELD